MNKTPEQLPLPELPEDMPAAPPGWRWQVEVTPTGVKRLALYPDPFRREKKASEENS